MDRKEKSWNPAVVVLVFCFLQGVIFLVEWFFFLMALAREVPLAATGSKALARGALGLP